MKTTWKNDNHLIEVFAEIKTANDSFNRIYSGANSEVQPIQTMYGGAQLFKAQTITKIGELARKSFESNASTPAELASAVSLPGTETLWNKIHRRVADKLVNNAIEDYRIDFEDGYGIRPDKEEDATAKRAAKELATAMSCKSLSRFIGIRIKPLDEELKVRSIRTLEIFLTTLLESSGGILPDNFIITLPKVTVPEQVSGFCQILKLAESKLSLPTGSLQFEIMIETPQSVINQNGLVGITPLTSVGGKRCRGVHFGTYDYTAGNDIAATEQAMGHPACHFALQMIKVSLAGTPLWLSDGATSIMPVAPHKGPDLSSAQLFENKAAVHHAWKVAYDNISTSLQNGYYQGWDLHPAQLPIRYTASYSFFLKGLDLATERLKNFIEKSAQATLVGDVFDDAATGQGLLNYFLRALNCGAISHEEVLKTGLTLKEIQSKSFKLILEGRRNC